MAESLNISDIKLFNLQKAKFGEKDAEQFVFLVKEEIQNAVENKHRIVSGDIAALQDNLFKNFSSKSDLLATKSDLQIEIAQAKTEILKWTFVFVFSSTLLSITSILAIIKFFIK